MRIWTWVWSPSRPSPISRSVDSRRASSSARSMIPSARHATLMRPMSSAPSIWRGPLADALLAAEDLRARGHEAVERVRRGLDPAVADLVDLGDLPGVRPAPLRRQDEARQRVLDPDEHEHDRRRDTAGDPALAAVQAPSAVDPRRRRPEPLEVAARLRLGDRERRVHAPAGEMGQPAVALVRRALADQQRGREPGRVDRPGQRDPAARQDAPHGRHLGHGPARAAVLARHQRAGQPELDHLVPHPVREHVLAVPAGDVGQHLVLDEPLRPGEQVRCRRGLARGDAIALRAYASAIPRAMSAQRRTESQSTFAGTSLGWW